MFVESLNRHLLVASLSGAEAALRRDRPGFWNVVSLLSPEFTKPQFHAAKRVLFLTFDDAEIEARDGAWMTVRPEELARAFRFWSETAGEPLLIHCFAGISRSTGLALSLIMWELWGAPDLKEEAVNILLAVRPQARPNRRVLELGLRQFLSEADGAAWAAELLSDPRIVRNR